METRWKVCLARAQPAWGRKGVGGEAEAGCRALRGSLRWEGGILGRRRYRRMFRGNALANVVLLKGPLTIGGRVYWRGYSRGERVPRKGGKVFG